MAKDTLKSFLTFSKKELNGLLVFCFLIVAIISAPYAYRLIKKPETFSFEEFKDEIEKFRISVQSQPGNTYVRLKEEIEDKESSPQYFEFDPNSLSAESWRSLGLSTKQIAVIKNYENKGGKFYRKEDLQKIYSITKKDYLRLEPYIRIPEQPGRENKQAFVTDKPVKSVVVIELNAADSSQLVTIRGVGPAFASRIMKYRKRLGGFYKKEQLKEIYGIDSAKYEQLQDQVTIDVTLLQKLNINSATFDDLKYHPYLNYRQVNTIIQYRNQHGTFSSVSDMKKIGSLNEELFIQDTTLSTVLMIADKLHSAIRDIPDFPKPGIIFKDITPIFQDPGLCTEVIDAFAGQLKNTDIDVIAGIESRGFLFGLMLASRLNLPFVLIRKVGKLPHKTFRQEYALEYGSAVIEIHADAFAPGKKVLIHDDLLATGGTVEAASMLITQMGGKIAGYCFLVELDFLDGRKRLLPYSGNIISLTSC